MKLKKYFKNLEHLNESLKETFGSCDFPKEDAELDEFFKKCEAEGYGYFDSDGDFMFNTPLEDFTTSTTTYPKERDMTEIADIFDDEQDDTTYEEDLKQTVLDMYPIYNESEILKLVVEFIAKEHCGGVN